MFKLSLSIFIICVSVLLVSSLLNIHIFFWEVSVTIGSAGLLLRIWLKKSAHDDMIESMYSKYDRPSNGKPPEYHGL
ncbi:MAG: hypothetical protein ABI471_08740 [Sphingomonas bacterium]